MASEWLKVMLEEIARKRDERERAEIERAQREAETRSTAGPAKGPRLGRAARPS